MLAVHPNMSGGCDVMCGIDSDNLNEIHAVRNIAQNSIEIR